MRTWKAKFWRSNPQLKNGGYETTVTIEAENKRECNKKVKRWTKTRYGSMELLELVEMK